MGLVFKQIFTEGLAQLSYVVGDDKSGMVAVIDPRRDIEVYIEFAQRHGLKITHTVETHIHADFVSGVHELRAASGAEICGGDGDYGFDLTRLREGDEVDLGSVKLRAIETPGHTPEHISLLLFDEKQGEAPFGVFTGDTLFNLDVGRPDLLGEGNEQKLAELLYDTLFKKLCPLGERVEVYPCHGAGSACGKSIGDRLQSTIGNELLFNPALTKRTQDEFKRWLLDDMPPPPEHYAHLKQVNAAGAPMKGRLPTVPPVMPGALDARIGKGATILDCRSILAFGGGHIPGAINVALRPEFPTWAGRVMPYDQDLVLVTEDMRDLKLVTEHLFRIGHDRIAGYLHQGMTSWQNAGKPLSSIAQWSVNELNDRRGEADLDLLILDVRTDQEWAKGHIPHAKHIFVAELESRVGELDQKRVVTYCGTGYRASIAASLLKRAGVEEVINIPGSWTAWQAAKLPVEK